MTHVNMRQLEEFTIKLLAGAGLSSINAETMAEVFIRSTLRGVGHHDIYDLPNRLRKMTDKEINIDPNIHLLKKQGAVESYEGDNGPGELCASFIMTRAEKIADEYGIGFCTVRNSHHFLASAPYIEKAAEEGYLGIIFSRGLPAMNAPGVKEKIIGNNPLGFAAATGKGYPIMLDIAMAYTSYGKLQEKINLEEEVPLSWGKDANGSATTDPTAIKNGGSPSPIAGHKGFGLALLVEILTGVLSGGTVIDQTPASRAQAAIAIKIEGLMPLEEFKKQTAEIIERMEAMNPEVRIPGRNSYINKQKIISEGIDLDQTLLDEMNQWAEQLGVEPLH